MNSVFNRIVLLLGLTSLILSSTTLDKAIIPILAAVSISGFLEYFESSNLDLLIFFGYTILCLLFPPFIFFIPLAFYDLLWTKFQPVAFIALLPAAANLEALSAMQFFGLVLFVGVEVILKHRSNKTVELRQKYIAQQDDFTETSQELRYKIRQLSQRQDAEIHLATLNERNRIAREIHDNVGHLLSSSILQIGALMSVSKDEVVLKGLENVKSTLDSGMDSIRKSVHDLHNDSVNLQMQLEKLVRDFQFCPIYLNYEVKADLTTEYKYAVIAIVKEALSNIIRHSDATEVTINLYEHPSLLQLIIADNGRKMKPPSGTGMGLQSIRQRVTALDGVFNFNFAKGFHIFISFPKGKIVRS